LGVGRRGGPPGAGYIRGGGRGGGTGKEIVGRAGWGARGDSVLLLPPFPEGGLLQMGDLGRSPAGEAFPAIVSAPTPGVEGFHLPGPGVEWGVGREGSRIKKGGPGGGGHSVGPKNRVAGLTTSGGQKTFASGSRGGGWGKTTHLFARGRLAWPTRGGFFFLPRNVPRGRGGRKKGGAGGFRGGAGGTHNPMGRGGQPFGGNPYVAGGRRGKRQGPPQRGGGGGGTRFGTPGRGHGGQKGDLGD